MLLKSCCHVIGWLVALLENDEDFYMLALDLIRFADGGGFSDGGVADQAGLDLHRTQAVAADLDDVINTTLYAEVAHAIFSSGITGEVDAFDSVPIAAIAIRVSIDRAHLGRPGLAYNQ